MALEACRPTEKRSSSSREIISFDLLPTDDADHIDLDTGEIFQDYGYARLRKNEGKLITASAAVRPAIDESSYQDSVMHYFGGSTGDDSYEPSSIHFEVYVSPAVFTKLEENTRCGLFPETITVGLVDDPLRFFTIQGQEKKKPILEYGWEPDGSGIIWHNKDEKNQRIAVDDIRFHYEVVEPRYDQNEIRRRLPVRTRPIAEVSDVLVASVQSKLAEIAGYLRWIMTLGIVLVVIVVVAMMK